MAPQSGQEDLVKLRLSMTLKLSCSIFRKSESLSLKAIAEPAKSCHTGKYSNRVK